MQNWFGLTKGTYFGEPPLYVNKDLAPGMTPVPQTTFLQWLSRSPFVLIISPNFLWAIIALFLYRYAPYDITPNSAAALAPISYSFVSNRLQILYPLTLGYFSFWHISLYGFNAAKRPFIANRVYNVNKVIHNIFWTSSGVLIWTIFENMFCYLWATRRLTYVNDMESFTTIAGCIRFIAAFMGIPVWRSIHFYWAHRFLHFGPIYQQVHSLHHRNTDVEPFSGLCMHPVEHLYYFACVAPSLFLYCSPFALAWNGVHLLLSPAASHSGYEDHFQSDLYHYLHHRYFECNYAGSDAAFLDIFFGTYKGSFADHPKDKDRPLLRNDAKSTLFSTPTNEFLTYIAASSACVGIWYASTMYNVTAISPILIASVVGFGPIITAVAVSHAFGKSIQRISPSDFLHILIGTMFCSVPITYLCYLPFITKPVI